MGKMMMKNTEKIFMFSLSVLPLVLSSLLALLGLAHITAHC